MNRNSRGGGSVNLLENANVMYVYGGLFGSRGLWRHPDRTEVTWELIAVTEGEVCMSVGADESYTLQKGEVLLLEPGVRHFGSRDTEHVGFYWVHFSLAAGEGLPFDTRHFAAFEDMYLFKELLHDANLPDAGPYLTNAVLVHILAVLCRLSEEKERVRDKTAMQLYEWLRINARASLTVKEAAAHFSVSPDHVTRLIRRSFGCGGKELIDAFLLAKSKEYLCTTELYVGQIADTLGFSSSAAFVTFFKYHEGVPPTVFRNRFDCTHLNNK